MFKYPSNDNKSQVWMRNAAFLFYEIFKYIQVI
jgi:hypothetical protein